MGRGVSASAAATAQVHKEKANAIDREDLDMLGSNQ
jgi:hypothetical protein